MRVSVRQWMAVAVGLLLLATAIGVSSRSAEAAEVRAKLLDQVGRPLKYSALIATPKELPPFPDQPTEHVIDQIDREFVPFSSVVRTGTRVIFPNRDNIKHQVYSFSRPKKFELDLYTGHKAPPVMFDKPGYVVLGCNIHDWMLGHVLVVDTAYFVMTDEDGMAVLRDLPAGEYTVSVWHPGLKSRRRPPSFEKTLQAGTVVELDLKVELLPTEKWKREAPADAYGRRRF